jgi:hypothetical protein
LATRERFSVDAVFGLAAGVILVVGFLRVFYSRRARPITSRVPFIAEALAVRGHRAPVDLSTRQFCRGGPLQTGGVPRSSLADCTPFVA